MTETATRRRFQLPSYLSKAKFPAFLTVVLSGQIVYSSFEAFKGTLLLPLQGSLGITQTEFGLLMAYIGLAMFFYVPAGWINNRFPVKTILFWSLAWRLATYLVIFLFLPPFWVLSIIAVSWGVLDAIMWPAVVNGVSLLAAGGNGDGRRKGLAMGLLESLRRGAEFLMNGAVILAILLWSDQTAVIIKIAAIVYALLIIPVMIAVIKVVPKNEIAQLPGKSSNSAALVGLLKVLARPKVWLAGIAALTIYWCYINLIYICAPFVTQVYGVNQGLAGVFGILSTGFVGLVAGVIAGLIADYVFRSSTKMLATALGCVVAVCTVVLLLPPTQSMLFVVMALLVVVAFATFLGKSMILAPIAELGLPAGISGSAMSVGSFLAYASVLWAYVLNGTIIDANEADPRAGYNLIFVITIVVAAVGCAAATALAISQRKRPGSEADDEPDAASEPDAQVPAT